MDKILSTRVDESVARRVGDLARRLGTSRKRVIERAVLLLEESIQSERGDDVFARSFGVWRRKESAERTVAKARRSFKASLGRHR